MENLADKVSQNMQDVLIFQVVNFVLQMDFFCFVTGFENLASRNSQKLQAVHIFPLVHYRRSPLQICFCKTVSRDSPNKVLSDSRLRNCIMKFFHYFGKSDSLKQAELQFIYLFPSFILPFKLLQLS